MNNRKKHNSTPMAATLVSAIMASWRKNWPLFAGAIALMSASAMGAIAVVPSLAALMGGAATPTQIILFAITVMTGVSATQTLNTGIRFAFLEQCLEDMTRLNSQLTDAVKDLTEQIASLALGQNYEIATDDPKLWSRLGGRYRAIMPMMWSEVETQLIRAGFVQYFVNPKSLEIWLQRVLNGDITIVIPKGCMTREPNILNFQRDRYDLAQLVRITVFLNRLSKINGVDMSKVRVIFSELGASDLKSIFLTNIVSNLGTEREAMILYSNTELDPSAIRGQVAIFYDAERRAEGEARWRALCADSTRWTVKQLSNHLSEFIPQRDGEAVPTIPSDFEFNAKRPFDYEDARADVVNGDHFTITRTARKLVDKVMPKRTSK